MISDLLFFLATPGYPPSAAAPYPPSQQPLAPPSSGQMPPTVPGMNDIKINYIF